jgi:hypothetical protein
MLRSLPALVLAAALTGLPLAGPAIADAGTWSVEPIPTAPTTCRARLAGAEVNVSMMFNNSGKVVLVAANAAWNGTGTDPHDSVLSINGKPPFHMQGYVLGPLFLALVPDEQLALLRSANVLDWELPAGKFHIPVEGLGAAMDQLAACNKARSTA